MISIVMATYNGEKYIRQQLESVLNQTRKPNEVIINDDCSTDETVQVITAVDNKWKIPLDLHINEKRLGYAQNFRDAISRAKGDIIFLCDQDDVWKTNKIEMCMDVMEQRKDILVLSTGYYLTNAELKVKRMPQFPVKRLGRVSWKKFIRHPKYPGMAMVFRKEIWKTINESEWRIGVAHDWMINQYAAALGGMFFLNEKLVFYRQHQNNAEGTIFSNRNGDIKKSRIRIIDELLCSLSTIQTDDPKKEKYLSAMNSFLRQRKKLLLRGNVFVLLLYELRKIKYISIRSMIGDIYVCVKGGVKKYV